MSTAQNVSDILGDVKAYAYNPVGIQRRAMAAYSAINDGTVQVVDATNPFVFAIETTCVNAAAMMQQAAALTRRQYSAAATTFEDLYMHMADEDYVNIFALPSEVKFYVIISKRELVNKLVLDPDTGIYKLTIPRNTIFYAAGLPFSIQYPIDIRQLAHGDLQIVYDATSPTKLFNLTTNVLDYITIMDPEREEFIQFAVDTQQFFIKSVMSPFDSTSGFNITVPFEDQYYAARVFVTNSDNTWREIQVTYTEQVYDPAVPTAVLQVVGAKLKVRLPLVYITTGLVSGRMRVDVYQTKGPLSLQLGNYSVDNFTAEFSYIDQNDASPYTAAFTSLSNLSVYAKDKTIGGREALSFEQLQKRVIENSVGPRKIPITPSQIQTTLLDKGYELVKNIDTLTNRIYWATKSLPLPRSLSLATSANANVVTVVTNTNDANQFQGCVKHDTGMTIGPKALIQTVNGISSLMTKAAYQLLANQPLADLCATLNAGNYGYSPFYYVLDVATDSFVVRPYYLDKPSIDYRSFIQENPDTDLQASIDATYSISKTDSGYRLVISTKSNADYKALPDSEVFCQLMFNSASQSDNAYMLGTLQPRADVGDERVFVFDIDSLYDIDYNDAMALPGFSTATTSNTPRCALTQKFSLLFGTSNVAAAQTPVTAIDDLLGEFQLPATHIGITHETLTITFGYALTTLWNSFRSFASTIEYQKHIADVPRTYARDVYRVDPVTNAAFTVVDDELVYDLLHAAGDTVLDAQGNPTYLHRAGDYRLDQFNRPIPIDNYQTILKRSLELVVLDGTYQFATDPVTKTYVGQINDELIASLTNDLVTINQEALEKTKIFYYPSITQGLISLNADNNRLVTQEAAQSLKVVLYVSLDVYNNKALTNSLQTATVKTIGDYLASHKTIAVSLLEDALASKYGDDVIGVAVSGLGGSENFRVMSVVDASTRLSVRKTLKLLPNSQIAVQEDITVVFSLHGLS